MLIRNIGEFDEVFQGVFQYVKKEKLRKVYLYPYFLDIRLHCLKIVCRSYSGPHFPAFRVNTGKYRVSFRIQSECGKMQTRITPNNYTFYAVLNTEICWEFYILRFVFRNECGKIRTRKAILLDIFQALVVTVFKVIQCTSNQFEPWIFLFGQSWERLRYFDYVKCYFKYLILLRLLF